MAVFQKSISIRTSKIYDFVEITDEVEKAAKDSKIKNGIVFVNLLHLTAALIFQENDPTILRDLIKSLEEIVPMKEKYEHNYEGNENATAHIKANLLGTAVTIPLKNSNLQLGTYQSLFVVELFEPRNREIIITIIGE
jgi:secondary thiamine-phosphate synthase enzyme